MMEVVGHSYRLGQCEPQGLGTRTERAKRHVLYDAPVRTLMIWSTL